VNLSEPFIRRPVATVLLTIGLALAGIAGFMVLPVSPLPQVDYPVISVSASLPGASPETMATSVATPLERRLGTIAGVNEMTSQRRGLHPCHAAVRAEPQHRRRRARGAGRHQCVARRPAVHAAQQPDLPQGQPVGRAGHHPGAHVGNTKTPGQIYDAVSNIVQQKLAQVKGVGDVEMGGGSMPAVRVDLLPFALNRYGVSSEDIRAAIQASSANRPKGTIEGDGRRLQIYTAPAAPGATRPTATRPRDGGTTAAWSWPGAMARPSAWAMWRRSPTAWKTSTRWACSTASRP
jgi:multidrug efflux pump